MQTFLDKTSIPTFVALVALLGACSTQAAYEDNAIERLSPTPGQTNVDPNSAVRIELQTRPDSAHLADRLRIYDQAGQPLEGTVQVEAQSLVFHPLSPLKTNSTYRVCLQDLRTEDGRMVLGYRFDPDLDQVEYWGTRHCYSFSTSPTLEVTRTIFDVDSATLRIYFSDAVDASSLSAVTVLDGLSRNPIDSRIRYNPNLFRLTLLLSSQEPIDGPILVALPATIQSLDGHELSEGDGDQILFQSTGQGLIAE